MTSWKPSVSEAGGSIGAAVDAGFVAFFSASSGMLAPGAVACEGESGGSRGVRREEIGGGGTVR